MPRPIGLRSAIRFRLAALGAAALLAMSVVATRADAFVYWAGQEGDTIGRANLDGTAVSQGFLAAPGLSPCGVAVDGTHVFWGGSSTNTIGRADLDGTNVDPNFVTGAQSPCGVAVYGPHVYWANTGSGLDGTTIGRANLDGTAVDQSFIDVASGPCGVEVDGLHIYWTNFATNTIGRADLDGTNVDPSFVSGANRPCGVAAGSAQIDRHHIIGGHVYWANAGSGLDGTIGRADLDGANLDQSFIKGLHGPWGVAANDTHIYWGSAGTSSIGRADLDGTGVSESFITIPQRPLGVALDAGSLQVRLGKPMKLKRTGKVKLPAELPGPGLLQLLKTTEVKGQRTEAVAAGELTLTVKARGASKAKLDASGHVKVEAEVSFTPAGATPLTESTTLKLVKR